MNLWDKIVVGFWTIVSWVTPHREGEVFYTIDGGYLAPYPGMTDEDLYGFENDMNVPDRTWADLDAFMKRNF